MSDPFRDRLSAASDSELPRRLRALRIERVTLTQAALRHQIGRTFLAKRLADEQAAAAWQPGDTIESVAHRAGRVALLREMLLELDEDTTRPTPGA